MQISKLSVPLVLVGTLLVSALGAGVTYGATASQLAATVKKVESLEAEVSAQREWRARVETQLDYLARGIDRVERKLGTR